MSPHRGALALLAVLTLILQARGPAAPAASTAAPTSAPAPSEKPIGPLDPDPGAPARLARALRGPFSEASVSAVIEALARAGIATYADDGVTVLQAAAEPASGLRYLKFQARGMAMELPGAADSPGRGSMI
jgi:hypothetical protein